MESEIRNPYRPTDVWLRQSDQETLIPGQLGSADAIAFAGRLSEDDVEELLTLTVTAGTTWSLLIPVVFGTLALISIANWPWMMTAGGLALLFLVLVSLLSRSHRRADFLAFHPHWASPVSGTVTRDGYEILDGSARFVSRWSSVANAYSNDRIVAFRSSLQSNLFRVISRDSVASQSDWDRLCSVADSIHCEPSQGPTVNARIKRAKKTVLSADRERIVSVPQGAIAFAGAITNRDLKRHPRSPSQDRIVLRTLIYAACALTGVAVTISGMVGLAGSMIDIGLSPLWTLLAALVGVIATAAIWFVLSIGHGLRHDATQFVQIGFLSAEGITVDFGCFARLTPWPEVQTSYQDRQEIVLAEPSADRYVTLREEMFADASDWRQGLSMIPASPS